MLKKMLFLIALIIVQSPILGMENEGLTKKALEGNLESDMTYMFENVDTLDKSEKYLVTALEEAVQSYGIVQPTIIVKVLDRPTKGLHHSSAIKYTMANNQTGMEVRYIEEFTGLDSKPGSGYCVFYNPKASSSIDQTNVARLKDEEYVKHNNIATLYHELAHIHHGDTIAANQLKESTTKWASRGLFFGLTLLGLYGVYTSKKNSIIEKCCLVATPFMPCIGEHYALKQSRAKEVLADKIAYRKLLAKKQVLPVIASFFYFLEMHKNHWPLARFPDLSSHPNCKYRAHIVLDELQKAGYDLLALPISARYAKVFNQELKRYFPSIYQCCIDEYAKLT